MLRLVLGRSGSGKTEYALAHADELAKAGKKVILIVPEQFTFETEKALLSRFGAGCVLNIEVLSFSRLCGRVLSECGGGALRYIDDSGRLILMQLALKEVQGHLRVYDRQALSPAFVNKMAEAVSEYKTYGITGEMLDGAANGTKDGLLRQKLGDISLILQAYDAILQNGFADSLDDLTRLAEKLEQYPFYKDKNVIIDSFKGFTPQEKKVLAKIMQQAGEVTVTLTMEQGEGSGDVGLFSPVEKTRQELIRLANKAGCPVASMRRLEETKRFQSPALVALEERIFRPGAQPFEAAAKEIHIVSALNIYDEAEYAARQICSLVRDPANNCRYRDIVIIARSLGMYDGILDAVFEKYGIPLFLDSRRGIETHPLISLILAALDIAQANFRADDVFRYLKTGLAGFTVEEVSELENYALMWDIKGIEAWQWEWNNNPNGFVSELTKQDEELLQSLNEIKGRLLPPLFTLREALRAGGSGAELAEATYNLLVSIGAQASVQQAYDELRADGEQELADEYRQIYEKLMALLDQIAFTLGDTHLNMQDYCELFHLVTANADMGHIPPTLDQVTAGDAQRIRSANVKYAFVIGLADGVFPQTHGSEGLLTDAERRELVELGLELAPSAQEKSAEERFLAYQAFSIASHGVTLTCPRGDVTGRTLRPSFYLNNVKALFPGCDLVAEALADSVDEIWNTQTAFEKLASSYRSKNALVQAVRETLNTEPDYHERIEALKRASEKALITFQQSENARALFGENIQITPSRLENFRQCPFLYFCRYGLSAYPRGKAELAAPEIGTLIHFVLEKLLSKYKDTGLWKAGEETLAQDVKELLAEFAAVYLGGLEDKPERFKYLFLRLEGTVLTLVGQIARELEQSSFSPVDFELGIQGGGEVAPLRIELPGGGSLTVSGKVDRVDTMQRGGKTYLRVVDYKTGSKEFNLTDVVYGLNLQMFIYLFTLCENGAQRYSAGGEILPAGVLYLPAKRPNVQAVRNGDEEQLEKEALSAAQGALKMNGLLLDDPHSLIGMERDGGGLFIPAKVVKTEDENGAIVYKTDARASVASLENFGALKRHIEKTLTGMAMTLREGEVGAVPAQGLSYHPCDYCDYISVCGHEAGDPVKSLTRFDKEEVWHKLREDERDG